MREFKFRVWIKQWQKMQKISSIDWSFGDIYIEADLHLYSFQIDEVELMQFTGLKDKYGKEIYEGDIVSHPNPTLNKAEIKFTKGIFRIVAKDGRDDLLYYCHNIIEVIGNIYENPELLGGKNE